MFELQLGAVLTTEEADTVAMGRCPRCDRLLDVYNRLTAFDSLDAEIVILDIMRCERCERYFVT